MAEKVCDKYCLNCIYYVGAVSDFWFCNYYLMTDKRRPCDPGTGCTVRVLRKKKRKSRQERDRERWLKIKSQMKSG